MEYLRQAIDLAAGHPLAAVALAIATLLYLNLMLSGPRAH